MALMEWNDSFNIGVPEVDRQHRHLVEILNRLHAAMLAGNPPAELARVVQDLLNYTRYHFDAEERAMRDANYPELSAHQQKHRAMVERVEAFSQEMLSGKATVTMRLLVFLKEWLARHILETDRRFGVFMAGRRAA